MKDKRPIFIIEEKRNPSTDYYIIPLLKHLGYYERSFFINSPPKEIKHANLILIFVRYITRDWVNFVEKNRNKIKKIIYFFDDDLFDMKAWKGLPLRYIKKLFLKAYRWKKWLINIKSEFFVSTEYLAKKYAYLDPSILPPYPIFEPVVSEEKANTLSLFYFGTDSHLQEKLWLYDIIEEIMNYNREIVFEIIGGSKVYRRFKNLKNVIVLHPIAWDAYKNFLLTKKRHIALVPFLNGGFRSAKSYIKFFEIVACGAVGIYSKNSPYEEIIKDRKNGILVPNEKAHWIEAIKILIDDEGFRHKLFLNSVDKLNFLRKSAEKVYLEIIKRRMD